MAYGHESHCAYPGGPCICGEETSVTRKFDIMDAVGPSPTNKAARSDLYARIREHGNNIGAMAWTVETREKYLEEAQVLLVELFQTIQTE